MFVHNFKYTLKTLFRGKSLIFWTFAFPIILGLFFNMAFSDIESSEKLDIINIAIIDNESYNDNEIFKETFKVLSDKENEERLFEIKYVDESTAQELLNNEEITGYVKIEDDTTKIIVKTSGINETILKFVTEEIRQNAEIVKNLAENEIKAEIQQGNLNIDYEKIYNGILEIIQNQESNIKDISNSKLSYTMIEYYTLIAMACLYAGTIGVAAINNNLANMSSKGKRVAVSPISKAKIVFSSVLASYVVSLIGLVILFVFTILVLKVDFGENLLLMIILGVVGSLAGLTMGVTIGTCLKTNEGTKSGIIIAISMLGCYLAGMMGITMKYIVDKNMPIINKINPAAMITDGFYSLYYYNTLDRYFFNVASLLIFSAIMIAISCISLRRQKYDSI